MGELVDMYHSRKATVRHDKVFALLGMSSDDLAVADILPDYEIPWEILLKRIIAFLLGEQVSIKTWFETEMAIIRGEGFILGKVSSTEYYDRDDRQQAVVILKDASGHLGAERRWTLPPLAKSVEVGDLVCLLRGATNPTVIRLCKDHFSIIMITAPSLQPEQPITKFPHDFLLLWDWEKAPGESQDRRQYDTLMKRRASEHSGGDREGYLDKMTRLCSVASILEDGEEYKEAEAILGEIVEGYHRELGEEDPRTLAARDKLAAVYRGAQKWEEAKALLEQVIQTRIRSQGTDHPDTIRSRAVLASTYRDQGLLRPEKQRAIMSILEWRGDGTQVAGKEAVKFAGSLDEEVMKILFDQRGSEVKVTGDVVVAAARNWWRGECVMRLLLDRRGSEVRITEDVLVAAAENNWQGEGLVRLLLDRGGSEVEITERVVEAAEANKWLGEGVMRLLLDRRGSESRIAERAVAAPPARNRRLGGVMRRLANRGSEVKIAERAAAASSRMRLFTFPPPAPDWELKHGKPTLQ